MTPVPRQALLMFDRLEALKGDHAGYFSLRVNDRTASSSASRCLVMVPLDVSNHREEASHVRHSCGVDKGANAS